MRKLTAGFISCLLLTPAAVASGCGADAASPVDGALSMEPQSWGPTVNRGEHNLAPAASALAAPQAETVNGDGDVQTDETCYHPSSCSRHWAGLCEDYCGRRGFSHMSSSGCGFLAKKCCCNRP